MRFLAALCVALSLTSCRSISDVVDEQCFSFEFSDADRDALALKLGEADDLYAEPRTVERVEKSLEAALDSVTERNGYAATWRALRAGAWLALHHEDRERKLAFGERAVAIGEAALKLEGRAQPGHDHFYLALSMAAYCEEKGTCATEFVRAMRDHAIAADAIDPSIDHCGPARFLGQLIVGTLDYPAYSLGSLEEAIEALRRANKGCPDFPENWLALAEALFEDGDDDAARELFEKVVASKAPKGYAADHAQWVEQAKELLDEL